MPTEISNQFDRIETSKENIKQAIRGKGVTVPTNAKITDLAPLISSIRQSSGTGDAEVDTCTFELDTTNIGATLTNGRKITLIYTLVATQGEWVNVTSNLLQVDNDVALNRIAHGSYLVVIMPDGVKAITDNEAVVYQEGGKIFVYDCRPSQGGLVRASYLLDD